MRIEMKFLILIICLISTQIAEAQSTIRRNDRAATSQISVNGQTGLATGNQYGRTWNDVTIAKPFVHSNPVIPSGASTTLVAANLDRNNLIIQNNSGGDICINFSGTTLSSIAPSDTNPCIVLISKGSYTSPANAISTAAVIVYQSSGSPISSVSVIEQSK